MAGLLDPDFVIGRDGLPMPRIEPPTKGLLAADSPTLADAWQFNAQAASDWINEQRAISEARGLWNPETGLPTAAGVVDAAGQTAQGILMGSAAPKGIRAYHGSPHDFDAFDTSKIGTGEGAQAYGHGLYFAENEGVARSYRDNLSGRLSPTDSAAYRAAADRRADIEAELNSIHSKMVLDSLDQGAPLDPDWGVLGVEPLPHIREQYQPQWDAATARLKAATDELDAIRLAPRPKGSMYEVNINVDPEMMLHWDKPLSAQSPLVRAAIDRSGLPPPEADATAGQWVKQLGDARHGEMDSSEVSRMLQEAGIPGIRYLDANSRRAGEGTHNVVAFDAAKIEILRKYLALLTAGGAGGVAAGSRQ